MTSSFTFASPACDENEDAAADDDDACRPPSPWDPFAPPDKLASRGVGTRTSPGPPSPPPFRDVSALRRPHAMMLNLGPPIPRVSLGTPCLNLLLTSVVNANTSPFR